MNAIHIKNKLSVFSKNWHPHQIAIVDDMQVLLAKIKGEFVWHEHEDTDETFIVLEGHLIIELREGRVELAAGEMFIVPKGVEHKPVAVEEVKIMLIEPRGVVNTGNAEESRRTAANDVWI